MTPRQTNRLCLGYLVLCLLAASASLGPARAQDAAPPTGPPTAPILRVELGAHSSEVIDVSLDARQHFLASASYDKTVRIWDAATGDLLSILRPPIPGSCGGPEPVSEADAGKLIAVAVSPDGRQVACGGGTGGTLVGGYCFYVFDRVSGQIVQTVGGLLRHVYSLAYSPDGAYLAVGLNPSYRLLPGRAGSAGVQLYRTSDYRLVAEDRDYTDKVANFSFTSTSSGLRLAACGEDGAVRLYSIDGRSPGNILKLEAKYPVYPYRASFSPDGHRLAVGIYGSLRVLILVCNPEVTRFLGAVPARGRPVDPTGSDSDLMSVAWSSDGRTLYAAGNLRRKYGRSFRNVLRRWTDFDHSPPVDTPVAGDTVNMLVARRSGGVFWGSGDGSIGALNESMEVVFRCDRQVADLLPSDLPWRISHDGQSIVFGYGYGDVATPGTLFTVASRTLRPARFNDGLTAPVASSKALPIEDWHESYAPSLNGVRLKLATGDEALCSAVAPDGRSVLLGTGWNLVHFDATGALLWSVATAADTYRVSVSGDGRLAVAGLADGTIHWYRMSDGQELLTLLPDADRRRWVAWTPSGYYDCSPGGEDLIGWHVNRGADQAADFFPASRYRDVFYRPDVVARVLTTLDEGEAVKQADAAAGRPEWMEDPRRAAASLVLRDSPPVVTILSPEDGSALTADTVTMRYALRTPSGEPARDLRVLVDGRPAGDPLPLALLPDATSTAAGATLQVTVTVPARDCTVSLIAEDRHRTSAAVFIRLTYPAGKQVGLDNPPPPAPTVQPTLYVLAVGVSHFHSPDAHDLTFPAKDAADFVDAVRKQKGPLYRDVVVYGGGPLTDAAATKGAIEDGLDWLQSHATTADDVAMVYLSGHGYDDPAGHYYYVPSGFDLGHLKNTALPGTDLFTTVQSIQHARVVVFDDTCYSGDSLGRVDTSGFINALTDADNGAVVFAAATGDQEALEDPAWGNGAFTKAVVEALQGRAAYDHDREYDRDGVVDFNMLTAYTYDRVRELTGDRQQPASIKPITVLDFPIARVQSG